MQKLLLVVVWLCCGFYQMGWAQCPANSSTVEIVVRTDNYGYETGWSLISSNGVVYDSAAANTRANTTLYRDTICVPRSECMTFRITDTYGDGMCCNYGQGEFYVIVDGDTVTQGGAFARQSMAQFNCPVGAACLISDTAYLDTFVTQLPQHWYTFVPDSTGMYEIATCNLNTCDTRIWVYDNCSSLVDTGHVGTVLFDNNACGLQSRVTGAMQAGVRYYIRVGSIGGACAVPITWVLRYSGAVRGCTDPAACNYNPLASVSDTCIYWGSPACPLGPDLSLRQDVLASSLQLATYNTTDACLVMEECVTGMGMRDLVRFTTHIENNGTTDYYVGIPSANNPQFTNNNCHGHWHYEGYAEYILFDQNGTALPLGFKNGFCVMDLTCDHGGTAQYGCSNMGISAGCGDIYDRSLACQWVDVTNVPDGSYTLVVRVNWDRSPDYTGRYETDYNNNWAQACITLSRATGSLQMLVNPACPVVTDCAGNPFGSAQPDCAGVCNGSALRGDINANQAREQTDVDAYLTTILAQNFTASECIDLYRDTTLNVYDASLLQRCLRDTAHCHFPTGVHNIVDTVRLSVAHVDMNNRYIDIAVRNASTNVLAYQFGINGVAVDSVVSLYNGVQYPVQPQWNANTSIIAALPTIDSFVLRSPIAQPLCRVYFSHATSMQICLDSIYSIVSNQYQSVATQIEGSCFVITAVEDLDPSRAVLAVSASPNPFDQSTRFVFDGNVEPLRIELFDAMGKQVLLVNDWTQRVYTFHRQQLAGGVYYYKISMPSQQVAGKLIIE